MAASEDVTEEPGNVSEDVDWTPENEVHLFYAMRGHKPVGVGKYFQMACIVEKFRNFANKDVTSKPLWEHLDTLYDMQSLDDIESMPFPNEERDFCLPEEEFGALLLEKAKSEPVKPDVIEKKDVVKEEVKSSPTKKEPKEKELKKENKEPKKSLGKESKKENKEVRKETKEPKTPKQRGAAKEKKEEDKEEEIPANPSPARKRDSTANEGKRGMKRPARGGNKSDDAGSNRSASPIAATAPPPPPPPQKRRRT